MTFLNWTMLLALSALAVPILIHLLNRRSAVVVKWGAMRFLMASLSSRRRRVMFEEILLMVLRCLLVAAVVLAMARPFLPSESRLPWAIVLPCVLGAAVAAGIGAGGWEHARVRLIGFAAAGVLAALAAGATAMEYWTQSRLWSGQGDKDVVIVLDGSMSMSLGRGKGTSFSLAVEEAKAIAGECQAGDAIGVVLAGGGVREVTPGVMADRERLIERLKKLKPTEGTMGPHEAIRAAVKMLEAGGHPRKWIVVITDGQSVGWDLKDEQAWQTTATELATLAKSKDLPAPPRVICRMLPRVQQAMNLAVTDITTSRRVVGTDRAVRIDVRLANTAGIPAAGGSVKLTIDGQEVGTEAFPEIDAGAAQAVGFHHTFSQAGAHVLTASIDVNDALPGDNEASRVLTVLQEVPVLIVDGTPAIGAGAGGSRFLEKALAPGEEQKKYLVRPDVMREERFTGDGLEKYSVVVLADVPELAAPSARKLAQWVQAGGGLLIAPGKGARPAFYDRWVTSTGQPVPAAKMLRRLSVANQPARLAPSTFGHPALEILLDAQAEPDKVLVMSYWELSAHVLADPAARVAGELDSKNPLLVERRVGRGWVLQLALALDNVDSTLHKPVDLVPLAHELVYYLAAPTAQESNVPASERVAVRLRPRSPAAIKAVAVKPGKIEVTGPDETKLEGRIEQGAMANCPLLTATGTAAPGVYRFGLPKGTGAEFLTMAGEPESVPFVVVRDPAESRIDYLTKAELLGAKKYVESLFVAENTQEVLAALGGEVPGEEIWKYLCLAGLLTLVGELIFTRWVAARRRAAGGFETTPAPGAQGGAA